MSPEAGPPVARLVRNIEGVILGKRAVLETVIAALLARGHVRSRTCRPNGGKTVSPFVFAPALW